MRLKGQFRRRRWKSSTCRPSLGRKARVYRKESVAECSLRKSPEVSFTLEGNLCTEMVESCSKKNFKSQKTWERETSFYAASPFKVGK